MRDAFKVHMLNEVGKQKSKEIAEAYDALLGKLEQICTGDKRQLAIATTKLEESCFFAKKAMATDPNNQQV